MLGINKYIISPIIAGLKAFNQTCTKSVVITESVEKSYVHMTKVLGASTGSAGLAKGSIDLAEALACQDYVCASVSAVGCFADAISLCTTFLPGANISTVVTVPVSIGCKTFVWACKGAKVPWGCKR